MPCRHLSCPYTFNFSIQPKSLQGPIPTIVGDVAMSFLESIGHRSFDITHLGLTAEILPPRGQNSIF